MPHQVLRVAAFCAYLAALFVFAIGAVVSGLPQIRRQAASPDRVRAAVAIGTLLQIASPMSITFFMSSGPLRPGTLELVGVLVLAPFAAALFICALFSAAHRTGETLVTRGVYAWLRHPIYLAFLGMLVATGLLASNSLRLVIAILLYLVGSELRIASEEKTLARKYHSEYEQYRRRTRWLYLPGLR